MSPRALKKTRQSLGLTQAQLAEQLRITRMTVTRYEGGTRRIPGVIEVALSQLTASPRIPMAGIVAAGTPIEPVPQSELIEVPSAMLQGSETFALRVKVESMRDEGILPNDVVVVRNKSSAGNAKPVFALTNIEATITKNYRKDDNIELRPANLTWTPF